MIIVCGLNAVQDLVDKHSVGRVVSLLGPDTPHRTFKNIVAEQHLKLTFHDVVEMMDGFSAPRATDAEKLIEFIEELGPGQSHAHPLLGGHQPFNGFGLYGALHAAAQGR